MRATLLAAAVAALLSLGVTTRSEEAPRVRLVDGTLALQNSREGQAIFSAEGLAPGGSASGSVTVANAGTLAGDLTLTQSDAEPGGVALSQTLQLVVQDVTGAPATVYSGPLSGLETLALGSLGPGAARVYSFTASLPAAADASVAGASMTVGYTWTATGEGPDGGTPPPPSDSTTSFREGLRLRLRVPARQMVTRGRLLVYARCDQRCSLLGSARLATTRGRTLRTRRARASSEGVGREARLALRLPKSALRTLSRLERKATRAKVTVTARSASGQRTVHKRIRVGWR